MSINSDTYTPSVEIKSLHKKFGDLHVLRGIDLVAQQGNVLAIIGGSGSGKSTMLRCINMLETPTEGEVIIEGETIKMKPSAEGQTPADPAQLRRIRSRLAMVFQGFNLWPHMSVLENIIEIPTQVLGINKDQAVSEAEKILDRVGLAHKSNVYPSFLSGGQQQRAAIARALAVQPKSMLFDEPTSALDPELVGEVLEVIADLAKEGRTMLLVTHEMKFARNVASKIVFLHNGLIEEEGVPDEVFDNPKSERLKKFLSSLNA